MKLKAQPQIHFVWLYLNIHLTIVIKSIHEASKKEMRKNAQNGQ